MIKKIDNPEFLLRKPIGMIVMKLLIGKLTPIGRKIFCYFLNEAQITVENLKKENRSLLAKETFSTSLRQLEHFLSETRSETTDSGMRSAVHKYLKDLSNTKVEWRSPGNNGGVISGLSHLVPQFEINDDENLISWTFPTFLMMELEKSGQYIPISLSQIARLRLYQSLCLYEICSRYKYNNGGLTCNNSPQWWVEVLSSSPQSDYAKPKIWRQIKSSVEKAISEINELTDITIKMQEFKTGKAVTSIQFSVINKEIKLVKDIDSKHVEVLIQATRLGLNIDSALTTRNVTDIKFALNKFEGQLSKNKVAFEKPHAYLNKILHELPTSVIKTVSAKIKNGAPNLTSQDVPRDPVSSISSDMQAEFLSLPLAERIRYCEMVAVDQTNTAILTKRMKEKLLLGDLSELLMIMVCERYALEAHGQI